MTASDGIPTGGVEPTSTSGVTTGGNADGSASAGSDGPGTTADVKFDLGVTPDGGEGGCGGGGLAFSYIWIANSGEGTITKLNTETMVEEGRYVVHPNHGAGSPSRTSVNLRGDVAVANRLGGITKVHARKADCQESNGQPGIQTSTGKNDVLPWGMDECIAWFTAMDGRVQRPMAWTSGEYNPDTCAYENEKAWTTRAIAGIEGTVEALRLNGDTGQIEDIVPIPPFGVGGTGPYGGAVDGGNNFWIIQNQKPPYQLARIDGVALTVQIYEIPAPVVPYGITVDTNDRVWTAGFAGGTGRFDPKTLTWEIIPITGLGLQQDAEGRMWIAHYPWGPVTGVHGIDIDTMVEIKFIDTTAVTKESRGISVDFNGYVWMVDDTKSAFRIDPETGTWDVYSGLTSPYTYSDMTGWGLRNVTPTPG